MILENCFRSDHELNELNINIIIQNKKGDINHFDFFFKNAKSPNQIYNQIYKSNLKNFFFFNSFERLIFNIESNKNIGINIIFKSLKNNFLQIESKNYLVSSISSNNLERNINQIIHKYFFKNKNVKKSYNNFSYQDKLKKEYKNYKFCSQCRINIEEMHAQRGKKAYLIEVINFEGKKSLICDLCFQGW